MDNQQAEGASGQEVAHAARDLSPQVISIMTTEPNRVVEPIHEKAMPVMLMTPDDVEQWLRGATVEDALKMQKSASDDAVVIRPSEKAA